MTWRLAKIGLYRKTQEPKESELRTLPFKERGLTIISGQSSTGKSAVLDIFDYCLLSKHCSIPKGVIRDAVSHVGVVLAKGEGWRDRLVLVRPLPVSGFTTSTEVFVRRDRDADLPRTPELAFSSFDMAKELLAEFTEIAALPVLTNDKSNDPEKRNLVSVRHCVPFLLQPQDVIANRNVLFSGIEDSWKKRHTVDALHYFLKIVSVESIEKIRRRRELATLKNQRDRQAAEAKRLGTKGWDRGNTLWREASRHGLIRSTAPGSQEELVAGLTRIANARIRDISTPEIPDLPALQEQEGALRRTLRQRRHELAEIDRFKKLSTDYEQIVDDQVGRLRFCELLPQPDGPTACPLCGNAEIDTSDLDKRILEGIDALQTSRSVPVRVRTLMNRRAQQLAVEIDELVTQAEAAKFRIESALNSLARTRTLSDEAAQKERLVGRIQEYVNALRQLGLVAHDPVEDNLNAELQKLDFEVGEAAIRRAALDRQKEVSERMTAFANHVDIEFPGAPARINLQELMVEVAVGRHAGDDVSDGGWVSLSEIGSATNGLGYHIVAALALHEQFRQQESPVPAVLMLDQPSQVWFPPEHEPAFMAKFSESRDAQALKPSLSRQHRGIPHIKVWNHERA